MRFLLVGLAIVMMGACVQGEPVVDEHPGFEGRILLAEDYGVIRYGDLDRTDVHTGAVAVPGITVDATMYYYLVPDGAYWRLASDWPPGEGACFFDGNYTATSADDTWDRARDGGDLEYDDGFLAWTDGDEFYRLGVSDERPGILVLVAE